MPLLGAFLGASGDEGGPRIEPLWRLIVLTLLVVEGLELQSFSFHPALFLVAGPVFFLCLPYFSQSELRGGEGLITKARGPSLNFTGQQQRINESRYPERSRSTSSRPDAIMVTSYHAKSTSSFPPSSCSHHVLTQQAQHLTQDQRSYLRWIGPSLECKPAARLEAARWQHADLYENIKGKAVTLHTILLSVGWTCYNEHTIKQFKNLGLDHQRSSKIACELQAQTI
eukprot:1136394-Pelagomonas_calceolata.AAC.1